MSKSNSWEKCDIWSRATKCAEFAKKTSAGRCFLPSGTFGEWGKRRQRSWAFLCQRQSQSHCQGPPHHLFKILKILFAQTILPDGPSLLVELDYLCVYVCPSSLDDRYLTLVILFMLFTLVTLFRSYEESLLQGRVYNRVGIFLFTTKRHWNRFSDEN